MRQAIIALFVFVVLLCQSCSKEHTSFDLEKPTIIAGKVLNYDNNKDPKTIQLTHKDFFQQNENLNSVLDSNGVFKITFPISYTQEFQLEYGGRIAIFCKPGDSLFLEIDRKLSYIRSPVTSYIQFMNNELGVANMEYNQFLQEQPFHKYIKDAAKTMLPGEYKIYILQREESNMNFLEDFCTKNNTSKLFRKWAMDHIKYESMNDLLRYCWLYPRYNKLKKDSFVVSNEYFSFLENYNMNDNEIFSGEHSDFLNELFSYSFKYPKDSVQKLYDKDYNVNFATLRNMIEMHSFGLTRKILFAKYYNSLLDNKYIDSFEASFDSTLILDPYLLNVTKANYEKNKESKSNEKTKAPDLSAKEINEYFSTKEHSGEIKLSEIESTIVSEIIESITTKHKGKVVLIDFWAPWCGPCMNELPYTQSIQEYFKGKNVDFIFMAHRCSSEKWKATIANKNLTGEHILLSEDQFNILSSRIGFTGIPHYTLIDKEGNIALKSATRPRDKEKLTSEIEQLLNK